MSCFKLPSWVRRVYNEFFFFFFPNRCRGAAFHPAKKKGTKERKKERKARLRCYHFLSFVSLLFTDSLDFLSLFLGTNGPLYRLLQYEQQVQAIPQRNRSSVWATITRIRTCQKLVKDSAVQGKNTFICHNFMAIPFSKTHLVRF